MDLKKTEAAAVQMRKELQDIVKNKEELVFYSANMLVQLRRLRKQVRHAKDELMALQNKQASSCICYNYKVAPDRLSICLQESQLNMNLASANAKTFRLPKDEKAEELLPEKSKPNFVARKQDIVAGGGLVEDEQDDMEPAIPMPARKVSKRRKTKVRPVFKPSATTGHTSEAGNTDIDRGIDDILVTTSL